MSIASVWPLASLPPMNATSYHSADEIHVSSSMKSGGRANSAYGQSHAVFNLGLDISPLRPRQRIVVRALLQRMTGMVQSQPGMPKS